MNCRLHIKDLRLSFQIMRFFCPCQQHFIQVLKRCVAKKDLVVLIKPRNTVLYPVSWPWCYCVSVPSYKALFWWCKLLCIFIINHAMRWHAPLNTYLPQLLESLVEVQFTPGFKLLAFLQVSVTRAWLLTWGKQKQTQHKSKQIKRKRKPKKDNKVHASSTSVI